MIDIHFRFLFIILIFTIDASIDFLINQKEVCLDLLYKALVCVIFKFEIQRKKMRAYLVELN